MTQKVRSSDQSYDGDLALFRMYMQRLVESG